MIFRFVLRRTMKRNQEANKQCSPYKKPRRRRLLLEKILYIVCMPTRSPSAQTTLSFLNRQSLSPQNVVVVRKFNQPPINAPGQICFVKIARQIKSSQTFFYVGTPNNRQNGRVKFRVHRPARPEVQLQDLEFPGDVLLPLLRLLRIYQP